MSDSDKDFVDLLAMVKSFSSFIDDGRDLHTMTMEARALVRRVEWNLVVAAVAK